MIAVQILIIISLFILILDFVLILTIKNKYVKAGILALAFILILIALILYYVYPSHTQTYFFRILNPELLTNVPTTIGQQAELIGFGGNTFSNAKVWLINNTIYISFVPKYSYQVLNFFMTQLNSINNFELYSQPINHPQNIFNFSFNFGSPNVIVAGTSFAFVLF